MPTHASQNTAKVTLHQTKGIRDSSFTTLRVQAANYKVFTEKGRFQCKRMGKYGGAAESLSIGPDFKRLPHKHFTCLQESLNLCCVFGVVGQAFD